MGLVGPVGPAKPLYGRISLPSGLYQVMNPLALVLLGQVCMVALPGASGLGEYHNPFLVALESGYVGFDVVIRPALHYHLVPPGILI
jgi:hypothetical protein